MEWAQAKTDSVKVKANLNEDGYLAKDGDTIAGYKYLTLNGLKHDLSHTQAMTVFNAIYTNIGKVVLNPQTAEITNTRGVVA